MDQRARLVSVSLGVAGIAAVFALAYGFFLHQARPRDVQIAVSAPSDIAAKIAARLEEGSSNGFVLSGARPGAAFAAVREGETDGAIVVTGSGDADILTAGAAGVAQQQAIEAAAGGAIAGVGLEGREVDLVPLPEGDRSGQSSFIFLLALVIPSLIAGAAVYLSAPRVRVWSRLAAGVICALLIAMAVVAVLDPLLGALDGAPLELFAFGALATVTFLTSVLSLESLLGVPGTGIGALVLLIVGNPTSGGTVPRSFLPDGFRQLSGWMPNSAIVSLCRKAVYFDSDRVGHGLLVLAVWLAVALGTIAVVDALQRSAVARTGAPGAAVYSIPGVTLMRRATRTEG